MQTEATEVDESDRDVTSHQMCDGCQDLQRRIERLETLLLNPETALQPARFSTHVCYALTLGIHVLVLLITMNPLLVTILGLPFACGAASSIVVCHVMANRELRIKLMRTLASVSVGCFVCLLSLSSYDGDSALEYTPYALITVTLSGATGFLIAKSICLATGCVILVPGLPKETPKLQLRDFFLLTLFAAVWLAVSRYFQTTILEIMREDDLHSYLLIIAVVSIISTVSSIINARVLLSPDRPIRIWKLVITLLLSVLTFVAILWVALFILEGGSSGLDWVVFLMMPAAMMQLSSIITFSLMRSANYRVTSQSSALPVPDA